LRREGWCVNRKRVYRLYRLEGLSLRHKKAKKRVSVPRGALPAATAPNERWSMDFLSDNLADGRRYRILALGDPFSRVSPALEAAFSFPGKQVVAVLDRVAATYGVPKELYVDNGPEFAGKEWDAWAYKNQVKLCFSRPGKPTDNAYIESFNGKLRLECLDQHWFATLPEAQEQLSAHRKEHNQKRPHTALGFLTPEQYLAKWRSEQQIKSEQT
jgi:putative transposase